MPASLAARARAAALTVALAASVLVAGCGSTVDEGAPSTTILAPSSSSVVTEDAEGSEGSESGDTSTTVVIVEGGPSSEVSDFVDSMRAEMAGGDLCSLIELVVGLEVLPPATTSGDVSALGTFLADYMDALASTSPVGSEEAAGSLRTAAAALRQELPAVGGAAIDAMLADESVAAALEDLVTAAEPCLVED